MHKSISTPIRYLKGIGPNKAKAFNKLGIKTVEDLFYHFPRRYEDRSNLLPISKLEEGKEQTIKAIVLTSAERQSWKRRGFHILEVIVADSTAKISCVWFNQPFLKNYFKVGQSVVLYGRVERYSGKLQMNSPEFEIISEDNIELIDNEKITPIYTITEGITQRYFRNLLKKSFDEYLPKISDCLPYDIRARNNLLNLANSLREIHFPADLDKTKEPYRRLAFEEFFLFQIPVLLRKLKRAQLKGISHKVDGNLSKEFIQKLPFELTKAQERVINEIKSDMAKPQPMNRLLQGDVGSGKTIVAVFASLFAIQGGYQVAFMVPTELLAQQHYQNISAMLSDLRVSLLTGSQSAKEKIKIYNEIEKGKTQLIIGTHSLLQAGLNFKKLGFVIIDEQHKFGVSQRAVLPKRGINPDVLIMTATPIPRTLAITIYGDLDISVIDELPPSRKTVKTESFSEERRKELYEFIEEKVKEGRQVYIIYPIIEESYVLDLNSANKMYNSLKIKIFPSFNIGLIHGQLKTEKQNKIMSEFKSGKIDILVATTVLEVGIDISNATVMVIENAERFGLSQLHQLRGRIGRGQHESYCRLISKPQTIQAKQRIKAMVKNSDGFRIAEEDLKIRGPGEYFGKRQHGLTELRISNPLTQLQLLKRAREEVRRLVSLDPNLGSKQNILLRGKLRERFPSYEEYVGVG